MSLIKLSLAGNNFYNLVPVSDIQAGDGKTANVFLQCKQLKGDVILVLGASHDKEEYCGLLTR
jgi:hypothetical protein